MKKIISAFLVCALLLGTMFALVSCGNSLSGTYEGSGIVGFDLKFKGNKVTIVIDGEDALTGTYEIETEDDKKTISFDFVDEEDATDDEKAVLSLIDAILGSDLPFEKDGDTIKIGKYIKLEFTKK